MRFTKGDWISTTGLRFLGVTGTGELLAIIPNGSGLESGEASALTRATSFELGVWIGLAMYGG